MEDKKLEEKKEHMKREKAHSTKEHLPVVAATDNKEQHRPDQGGHHDHDGHREHHSEHYEHQDHGERTSVQREEGWLQGNGLYLVIGIVAVLVIFNGFQLTSIATTVASRGMGTVAGTATVGAFGLTVGPKHTLAPMLTTILNQDPVLPGYRTRIASLPTISEISIPEKTGDRTQDAVNVLIPRGTPWYGAEAGVSFEDPVKALKVWGSYERSIQLSPELQQRWSKIVGSFTCDFCCGSPQSPTIIAQCGCSHAAAWRGIAKWFLSKYPDKYDDATILGEMSRWKALWYPGPVVQRAIQEGAI